MTLTETPVLPSGYVLHHLDTATSTMDEARALLDSDPDLAQVVWADTQTGGRGRRGRNWVSPAGNLYMTIAIRNEAPIAHAAECSFVAALALHAALTDLRPALSDKLGLKWPNDVLIGGAKVAGLLLELEAGGRWLLIGCGVNIASSPDGMPYRTTSLLSEDAYVPAGQLLQCFVVELQKWRSLWLQDGFSPIRSAWMNHAMGVGAEVTANLSDRSITGVFQDLDSDGALRLRLPDGTVMTISAGDIVFPNTAEGRS